MTGWWPTTASGPGSSNICKCSSWRRRKRSSRSSRCCECNWCCAGKWRASQVREQLVPAVKNQSSNWPALTPSLEAYDTLLEGEVAHVG